MPPPGLTYYPDSRPGISRRRRGRGFSYTAADGTSIDDKGERARIASLAVPPAYEKVWISPKAHGHLQATGFDDRARKQYRYHEKFREWREARKYDDLAAFGEMLPRIRRRIRADLAGEAGERDFAIAAVIALIDRSAIRVGHADYASENRTYGATTLTRRHLRFDGDEMKLTFRGKGNKLIRRQLRDRTLARVLGALHDLPGRTLFSWTDDQGEARSVSSDAVNARLSDYAGRDGVTAKTFRTWAGSEAALAAALRMEKPTVKALSEAASDRLHNTPTIARNSYIHPRVIALTESDADERAALVEKAGEVAGLRRAEQVLLHLLS